MKKSLKKRGQKFLRRFSRASLKASENSKEHIRENFFERFSHIRNIRLLIFEWILLATALILLATMQAFWSRDSYSEEVFAEGGTYTEATLGKINSLNPLFATTDSEKVLSRLMFTTLSEVDYSGNPGLGLASSISSDENGKTWKIKLRDNLKWSDGEPITNQDVIFTLNLIKNPAVASIYDANLAKVQIAESENGEIIFTLPTAYADFVSALNIPIVPEHILKDIDPKKLIEADFSTTPVTSGAFAFNATQNISEEGEAVIYLTSNPHYFRGSTMLSNFAVHAYLEKTDIINAIKNGTVTATAELAHTDAETIMSRQIYERSTGLNSGAFIFFNTDRPALKSHEVRAAIRSGISINELRDIAADTTALNYPLLQSQIVLANYPSIPDYNPEASAGVIAEKVAEDARNINIATVNYSYLPIIANSVADQLKSLGFNAEVSIYEENQEFITNTIANRNYDILIYEIELGADPDLLAYYHSSQASSAGLNLSNYKNTLVDDLLLGARETLDANLRNAKYTTFLNYWVEDVPAIGIYQTNLTYFYNRNSRPFGEDVHLVTALDRFSDITTWSVNKTIKNRTP